LIFDGGMQVLEVLYYIGVMVAPFVVAETLGYFGNAKFGFWLLVLFMCNSAFGLLRAVLNPNWYVSNALAAGVTPSYTSLIVTKVLSLSVGLLVAWHVGHAAGYI